VGAVAFKVIQYSASANVRSNCMGAVGESVGTPRAQRKGTDALSVRCVRGSSPHLAPVPASAFRSSRARARVPFQASALCPTAGHGNRGFGGGLPVRALSFWC
jgi:hypothetical protein